MKNEFEFSREEKHSFIADTRLKFDQIKRKMEENFKKPFFLFTNQIFLSHKKKRS